MTQIQDSAEIRKLNEMIYLEDNWDGDGAKKIPSKAIYDAMRFLQELEVCPSPEGEVLIYWKSVDHYVEINFNGQTVSSFYNSQANTGEQS